MRIVLIGAGKLATQLGLALRLSGHEVTAVWSRTLESAEMLTNRIGGLTTNVMEQLPMEADAFFVCVKDSALQTVIASAVKGRENELFLHTAGSMPLSIFEAYATRYGVFYPMQTFSKERQVDFSEIPIFIEANDESSLMVVQKLAESLSKRVYVLSSADRKYLHLAAVFACNFANHCYALSAKVLEEHGLPFDVMLPLIDETARKVHEMHPIVAQTGPAVRYDKNVIGMHMDMLAADPQLKDIYERLSLNIHEMSHD